jgi:hypothetical protein
MRPTLITKYAKNVRLQQWSLYIVLSSESKEHNFNFLGEYSGSVFRFDSEVVGSAFILLCAYQSALLHSLVRLPLSPVQYSSQSIINALINIMTFKVPWLGPSCCNMCNSYNIVNCYGCWQTLCWRLYSSGYNVLLIGNLLPVFWSNLLLPSSW